MGTLADEFYAALTNLLNPDSGESYSLADLELMYYKALGGGDVLGTDGQPLGTLLFPKQETVVFEVNYDATATFDGTPIALDETQFYPVAGQVLPDWLTYNDATGEVTLEEYLSYTGASKFQSRIENAPDLLTDGTSLVSFFGSGSNISNGFYSQNFVEESPGVYVSSGSEGGTIESISPAISHFSNESNFEDAGGAIAGVRLVLTGYIWIVKLLSVDYAPIALPELPE